MVAAADMSSSIERSAVRRLMAPGILDRGKLQRMQPRSSALLRTPLLSRLLRCMQPAALGASAQLPHVDRFAEPNALAVVSPGSRTAVPAVMRSASSAHVNIQRWAESDPLPVRLSIHAPGIAVPTANVGPALAVPSPVATRAVQRAVDNRTGAAGASLAIAVRQTARAAAGSTVAFRSAADKRHFSGMSVSSLLRVQRQAANGEITASAAGDHLHRVRAVGTPVAIASGITSAPAGKQQQMIARQVDATAASGASANASMPTPLAVPAGVQKVATASFASLLLRKAVSAAPVTNAPGIAPTSGSVDARSAAVPGPAASAPAGDVGNLSAAQANVTLNIDWIAQQVSSRLERRLEIERERVGVRSWRRSNY